MTLSRPSDGILMQRTSPGLEQERNQLHLSGPDGLGFNERNIHPGEFIPMD